LKKSRNCFLVKTDEKKFEVSAGRVETILITTSATITTDAIEFALENNIDIVFLNESGEPVGRVWHSRLGSTNLIRRRQLEASSHPRGFRMARDWSLAKLENQASFLSELRKNRPKLREELQGHIEEIRSLTEELARLSGTPEKVRGRLMGLEGMASRSYFTALSLVMPEKWKFQGRSRNPAHDGFNCLLNYGYGVLYHLVEKACIIAGLDPYIGIIHTDNYNKKSFVFDFIEPFRIHVDRTVVALFSRRQVKPGLFDRIPGGLTLNSDGKALLITHLNETFEKEVNYRGRKIRIKNTIQYEAHRTANKLIKGD